MDEVYMVVQGKADEWRIQRNFFRSLLLITAGKPVDIMKDMPLPFDDDLIENEQTVLSEAVKAYEYAKQTGYI